MTTSADGSQVPSQVTSGHVQDTSEEVPASHPEFMRGGAPISDPGDALRDPAAAELNKLNSFLMVSYPSEMSRSNVIQPESPVDVAIRLLQGKGITTGPTCQSEYCNLPEGHDGDHGFISYTPR